MAETPPPSQSQPSPPPSQPPSPPHPISAAVPNNPHTEYWCYHCEKSVAVEALPDHPDVICFECKLGFVQSISIPPSHIGDLMDDEIPPLSNEIVQFLRAIASPEDENDLPLPDSAVDVSVHVFGGVEESDENTDNHHEDDADENRNRGNRDREGSDDENEEDEEDELRQRQRRHHLRLRLHDHGLSAGRHDRILDWAELLLQLEDQSVTFGQQRLESEDDYIGNPGDYIDATGYDSFLQTLAESDSNDKRGPPPASKSAVQALQTVEVNAMTSSESCAVCKDGMFNNEQMIVKQLPCGHMYHGVCIMTWLDSRNTCPICRHELPTDDPEYEEERKQRLMAMASTIDHGCSSSSGSGV
ncbi:E3 ubiquitin-protein ligase CIP8 [Lactuca sativa]|uniref:E3 ubiquitin-protein ligase CIP8 n=1 Tax=Lactuca sativa TaxID=4236 RepID=UPI000CBECA88|nr:E3 ubiquitin-protein ligase CIP8 [Lactuca sativa]